MDPCSVFSGSELGIRYHPENRNYNRITIRGFSLKINRDTTQRREISFHRPINWNRCTRTVNGLEEKVSSFFDSRGDVLSQPFFEIRVNRIQDSPRPWRLGEYKTKRETVASLKRESDCFDRFQDERTNYLKAWNCLSERKASPEGEFMGFTPPTGGTKRNTAGRATPFRKIILARIRLSNYRTRRITPYSTLCSRIIHPVTQRSRPCNCFHRFLTPRISDSPTTGNIFHHGIVKREMDRWWSSRKIEESLQGRIESRETRVHPAIEEKTLR